MANLHGEIRDALNEICHTETVCGTCAKEKCMIGHSRYINKVSMDYKPPHVKGASETRPFSNIRGGFDEDGVLRLLAKTLVFCKSCKDNHTDDCVLGVIRNNMENLMFGEEITYEGNPLSHLVKATELNATKGSALKELYEQEKSMSDLM